MLDWGSTYDPFDEERREKLLQVLSVAMEKQARLCRSDFGYFARRAWHTIEPSTPYVHGAHIDAIVDHLTACLPRVRMEDRFDSFGRRMKVRVMEPGEIRNLLINMPPRHMKSTLVSVLWPAWVWTFRPDIRWLMTSYAKALAIRDTMKMRAVVMSPWYQQLFHDSFRLSLDQNEKSKFTNTAGGSRISGSVDSGVTGEGGDIVACDDPHNVRAADSQKIRESTNIWWFEAMQSRLNDANIGSFIVTMQRVHSEDLAAECINRGYVHLNLPARYDPKRRCVTVLGWEDWRSSEGELLWPERFPEHTLARLETSLGPYGTAAQLQQEPQVRGGAFIRRDWFKRISKADLAHLGPISWGRAWDLALSSTGDGVASVELGQFSGGVILRRGLFWHEDIGVTLARGKEVARFEKNRVVVEAIGTTKSAGEQFADNLLGLALVDKLEAKQDKVSMAIPWIAQLQGGSVYILEDEDEDDFPPFAYNSGSWIEFMLSQAASWLPDPTIDQKDDFIDAISIAFQKFSSGLLLVPGEGSAVVARSAYDEPTPASMLGYGTDYGADPDEDDGLHFGGQYDGGIL